MYVVMEMLRGGDLLEAITKEGAMFLDERDVSGDVVHAPALHGPRDDARQEHGAPGLKAERLIFAEKGRAADQVAHKVDKNLVKLATLRIAGAHGSRRR